MRADFRSLWARAPQSPTHSPCRCRASNVSNTSSVSSTHLTLRSAFIFEKYNFSCRNTVHWVWEIRFPKSSMPCIQHLKYFLSQLSSSQPTLRSAFFFFGNFTFEMFSFFSPFLWYAQLYCCFSPSDRVDGGLCCWLSPSVPEPVQKAGGRGRDVILTRLWQKVSDKIGQVPSHGYAMFIPNLNNDYSLCIDHSCVKSHHSEDGTLWYTIQLLEYSKTSPSSPSP